MKKIFLLSCWMFSCQYLFAQQFFYESFEYSSELDDLDTIADGRSVRWHHSQSNSSLKLSNYVHDLSDVKEVLIVSHSNDTTAPQAVSGNNVIKFVYKNLGTRGYLRKYTRGDLSQDSDFEELYQKLRRAEIHTYYTSGSGEDYDIAFQPREDYYAYWSVYVPDDFQFEDPVNAENINVVGQWHFGSGFGLDGKRPPLSIQMKGDHWQVVNVYNFFENGEMMPSGECMKAEGCLAKNTRPEATASQTELDKWAIARGEWTHWKVNVRFSEDDGYITVWKNNEQIYQRNVGRTVIADAPTYFKIGVYKPNWYTKATNVNEIELYYDDVYISNQSFDSYDVNDGYLKKHLLVNNEGSTTNGKCYFNFNKDTGVLEKKISFARIDGARDGIPSGGGTEHRALKFRFTDLSDGNQEYHANISSQKSQLDLEQRSWFQEDHTYKVDLRVNVPNEHFMDDYSDSFADIINYSWCSTTPTARQSEIGNEESTTDNIEPQDVFILYPNPTEGNLTIRYSDSFIPEEYRIINLGGEVLRKGHFDSDVIDISGLESGVYVIELTAASNIWKETFIKK